ncbi:MAG TPA: 2-hydroxyacyl-CoA dehydratase family protein, partial [Thermoplasmata archaeon]|nr:2-hydroxyacyl-CoA dehydratase family protein [Thermoplasmata archaeon]
ADAMVFSNICDVARNLGGVWARNSPRETFYLHLPMRFDGAETVHYARAELDRFWKEMRRLSGKRAGGVALSESIRAYNRLRGSLRKIDRFRQVNPHLLGAVEWYRILEACVTLPLEGSKPLVSKAIASLPGREGRRMDRVNVLVAGAFCERPPLRLMEVMEQAGCYVLSDDLLPSARYFTGDVDEKEEPLLALAKAYLDKPVSNSGRHFPTRAKELLSEARRLGADGVLFATAKFCEPALYDYVLEKDVLEAAKVPYLHIEYEEKMTAFEQLRSQIETFVESVLFFGPGDDEKRETVEVKV